MPIEDLEGNAENGLRPHAPYLEKGAVFRRRAATWSIPGPFRHFIASGGRSRVRETRMNGGNLDCETG